MGLDMYLYAREYVGAYLNSENLGAVQALPIEWPAKPSTFYIKAEIMYWRKANQIHNWFVQEVQNGVDECQDSYVPHEKLIELRDLIAETLRTRNAELLPPASGFFFGSTEIDEWYWKDLTDTLDALTKIVEHPNFEKFDYIYHSSW